VEQAQEDFQAYEVQSASAQSDGSSDFTEIYVWGNDYYGQLGVGSEKCVHRIPKICSFNIVIRQVSCGEEHTAFVSLNGGHVYSMGSNSEGKLGVSEKQLKHSNVPCLVENLDLIVKVACGQSHTLAISEEG
jgi:alpha-tubulin suppressor-like RCC1 family protein